MEAPLNLIGKRQPQTTSTRKTEPEPKDIYAFQGSIKPLFIFSIGRNDRSRVKLKLYHASYCSAIN